MQEHRVVSQDVPSSDPMVFARMLRECLSPPDDFAGGVFVSMATTPGTFQGRLWLHLVYAREKEQEKSVTPPTVDPSVPRELLIAALVAAQSLFGALKAGGSSERCAAAQDIYAKTMRAIYDKGDQHVCKMCQIEEVISTPEIPHPIDARFHSCALTGRSFTSEEVDSLMRKDRLQLLERLERDRDELAQEVEEWKTWDAVP